MNSSEVNSPTTLKRTLGFWSLAVYGVGDILGAGIYALIGEVAAEAGRFSPLSFLIAMAVAGLTGLTYSELVSRYPQSGGEATFCLKAFGRPQLAFLIGWMVFCSGVVSMSAVTHAFSGYVHALWPRIPEWPIWLIFLAAISLINFWGIRQSSMVNVLFTLVEASGLVFVIVVGLMFLMENGVPVEVAKQESSFSGLGVISAAVLGFYAYIGFEDMINVAEEVRSPRSVFPKAILTAVLVCGAIYVAVSLVSLAVVPVAELSEANGPLVVVIQRAAPAIPPLWFTVVALIAVANTGLLNCVMASRLIFGMSRNGLLPKWLSAVHPQTESPHRAVLVIFLVGIALVLSGTLSRLAETTSLLLLLVFAVLNAAAIRLRWNENSQQDSFRVPKFVPVIGLLTCLGLGAFVSPDAFITGGIIVAVGIMLMFFNSREQIASNAS